MNSMKSMVNQKKHQHIPNILQDYYYVITVLD